MVYQQLQSTIYAFFANQIVALAIFAVAMIIISRRPARHKVKA